MRFKCSLNNNYKIIGLCDLKKFNNKINQFKDKSYNQITLRKLITLPNNKPKIKTITKVHIGLKITSSKSIKSPLSSKLNIEGLNLTGRILLICGEVHFNIIYLSDTVNNSICSIKSTIPFNTYVILDKNSDIENDKYTVYPFIEDVSLSNLKEGFINSSITLFLFAHKIPKEPIPPIPPDPPEPPDPPVPPSEKLPNKITVKSKNNREVLSIEFDKKNQSFIVSSTGIIPDSSSSKPYLSLILKNQRGDTLLETALNSNENGTRFKTILNGKNFLYDKILLTFIYKDRTKIEISNYPKVGSIPYIPPLDFNIFLIEPTGLKNITLDSKIKIINDINNEMATLYFIKPLPTSIYFFKLLVTSTNAISTNKFENTQKYVEYLQYNSLEPILYSNIFGKQTSNAFKQSLDGRNIEIDNDILRLSNRLNNRIIITNYDGKDEYKIGEEPEFLSLISTGLIPHPLNYDKIRFKNKDNSTILWIYFDQIVPLFIYIEPYSTGILNKDCDLFYFKISNSTETTIKLEGRLTKNQSGDVINIDPPFNISRNLAIGDILEISCSNPTLVEVLKFPYNSPPSPLRLTPQKFKITEYGLVIILPPTPTVEELPNAFTFYSSSNEEMSKIEFDKENFKLIVSSTGITYNGAITFTAFEFQLRSSDGKVKFSSTIRSNENANKFKNDLNNKNFEYGDLISLKFFDFHKVSLSNYPNKGQIYEMKGSNSQGFKITSEGIVPYVLPNEILINNSSDNPVVIIEFDILTKRILASITGRFTNPTGSPNYFTMTLYTSDGTIERRSSTIGGNDTGIIFKNAFNNIIFDFGWILELEYEESDKVVIKKFNPTEPFDYNPTGNKQYFEITTQGLIFASLSKTYFEVKNISSNLLSTIKFDVFNKKLLVSSTFNIAYSEIGSSEYFTLILKDSNENVKKQGVIRGYGTGLILKDEINNTPFEYNDILFLRYRVYDAVLINNYPRFGSLFTPFFGEEAFKITPDGLKTAYTFLQNFINFKGRFDTIVSIVRFNITKKILSVVISYDIVNDLFGRQEYFALVLLGTDGKIKAQQSVKANETSINFKNTLDNVAFEYGDVIVLRYKERFKVTITNFPNTGEIFNPPDNSTRFEITQNGLMLLQ